MKRRVCRLADKSNRKTIDLRDYEDIILTVVNNIAPNKNPRVDKYSFSTDVLTQSEAVRIGLALSAIPDLAVLGKTITTFRLFDGRIVEEKDMATSQVIQKGKQNETDNNKEDKPHGRYHRKKIPNDRRNTNTIPTDQQEKNTSIREAVP